MQYPNHLHPGPPSECVSLENPCVCFLYLSQGTSPVTWDNDNTFHTEILSKKRYNSNKRTFPGSIRKSRYIVEKLWMIIHVSASRNYIKMEPELSAPLEFILAHTPVGLVVLDAATMRVWYANPYFLSLLDEPWRTQSVAVHVLGYFLPINTLTVIEEKLREAIESRQALHFSDIPYEGILETRGRTYW